MNEKLKRQLMTEATKAAEKSYAPYSKFHVGAALLTAGKPACNPSADGRSIAGRHHIITGANVENASYGLTICAERAALAAAVSAGYRQFEAIAIAVSDAQSSPTRRREALWRSTGQKKIVVPCGACLQALAEFCKPDLIVLAASAVRPDKIKIFKLRDLLPHVFQLDSDKR